MKRKILLGAVIIFLVLGNSRIYACTPCAETFDFEATAKHADLIIIGEKISEGPWTGPKGSQAGPEWTDVKILDVLKGENSKGKIRVNSWDGMCDYGIVIGEGKYIIFLAEREVDDEDYQYDTVHYSCSVKTYPVEDNVVLFGSGEEKKEEITVEKFIRLLDDVLKKE